MKLFCSEKKSRDKAKGLEIFRISTKDGDYSRKYRKDLVQIITRDRVVENQLREQKPKRSLYICELHYREDQM